MKDKNFNIVKLRVLQYADTLDISRNKFFYDLGISPANFIGENLKSDLSTDKIIKILSKYSDLNPDWLLLNKGEMLRSEQRIREEPFPISDLVRSNVLLVQTNSELSETIKRLTGGNI